MVLLYLNCSVVVFFPQLLCTILSSKESVACAQASNNKYGKIKFIVVAVVKRHSEKRKHEKKNRIKHKLKVHEKKMVYKCKYWIIGLIAYEHIRTLLEIEYDRLKLQLEY